MNLLHILAILHILHRATCSGVLPGPNFVGEIQNTTVVATRDAVLTCKVEHLRGYKVAWVQVGTQTILTIHNTVITRNPRIGLSRDEINVYNLHIKNSQEEDRGWYMCQINTDPMIKQLGFLQVVVAPDFEKTAWMGDRVVREGTNVTLECKARGYPPPTVSWHREEPNDPSRTSDKIWQGEVLFMEKVSRLNMGAYLCIASNGIKPSVSQRVQLKVQFPPMLWIENQLEGVNTGDTAILTCNTEAYPRSINYWTNDRGEMIADGLKFATEIREESYKVDMKLTIRNVTKSDFTEYRCIAKNSLGETDGSIKLYEVHPKPEEKEENPPISVVKQGTHSYAYENDDDKDQMDEIDGSGLSEHRRKSRNRGNATKNLNRGGVNVWRNETRKGRFPEFDPIFKDSNRDKGKKRRMEKIGRGSPFEFLNPNSGSKTLSSLNILLIITVFLYLL